MPDYIFNNTVLTQDDIEEIASIKGYTLDELFEKNPDIKQTDPDEEGKEPPSQETVDAAVEVSDTASNLENGFSGYTQIDPAETEFKEITIFEKTNKDKEGNTSSFIVKNQPKEILTDLGKENINKNYETALQDWSKLTANDPQDGTIDLYKEKAIYIQNDLIKNNKYLNLTNKQILNQVDKFLNAKGSVRDQIIEEYNLNDPNTTAETLEEANKAYNDQRTQAAILLAENNSKYQAVLNGIKNKVSTSVGGELKEFEKQKQRSEVEFKIPFTDQVIYKGISDNSIVEGLQKFGKQVTQSLYGIELMSADKSFGVTERATKAIADLEEKIKNKEINLDDKVDRDTKIAMQGRIKDPNITVKDALKFLNSFLGERKEEQFETITDIQDINKDLSSFTQNKIWEDDGGIDITLKELGGIAGEQLPQIGLALIARGVGVMAQEIGGNYITNLNSIARKKFNIPENQEPTPEQLIDIINSGEDQAGVALATGAVAGYLEKLSAGKLLKVDLKKPVGAIVRGEFKTAAKSLFNSGKAVTNAALTETLTEGLQTGLSQLGESVVTDENKFDYKELREASSQGFLMGGGLTSFKIGVQQTAVELKQTAMQIAGALGSEGSYGQLEKSFKALETKIKSDGRLSENSKNNRIKALGQVRNTLNSIPKGYSANQREKSLNLLIRKQDLNEQFKDVDSNLIPEAVKDQIESIDNQLSSIAESAFITRTVDMAMEEGLGDNIKVANTSAQADKIAAENNMSLVDSKGERAEGAVKSDGSTVIIDLEQAKKVKAFNVAGHELLHRVLFKTLYKEVDGKLVGSNVARSLGLELDKQLNKINPDILKNEYLKQRFKSYQDQGKSMQAEEKLTILSDALRLGAVKLENTAIEKFNGYFRRLFQNLGWKQIKFEDGKSVVNFIQDYNKSLDKGSFGKAIKKGATEGFEVVRGKDGIKNLKDDYENIIKESRSEEASNKVQELYDQKGVNAVVEIIEQFKPITNKIVEQRKNAPGFDRQLLTDEIETGAGGIFDLIQAYDPASNVPLAAYINKYLPVRAITASRRVLGEEFTDDITESVQVAAETAPEVEIEVAETKPTERLIEVKNKFLSPEGRTAFEEKIASRINELTPDEFTFKKLPNWGKEDLAKELNIPIKKFEGSSNFTQAELGRLLTWIETNVSDIRRALPGAAVLEGASVPESLIGTATGVPNNLLKNINLYERLARGTKDAGLVPYRKLKGIDNSSLLKAVGVINGKRTAGPRDKAAQTAKGIFNMATKVMTNQEIRKQLQAKPRPDITIKETESARAGGFDSNLLYSITSEAASLLSENNIKDRYNKFEDETGIDAYIADIPKMVKIFNTDEFKIFNATVLQFSKKALKDNKLRIYLRKKLRELKIKGELEKRVSTGRTAYQRALGNTVDQIEKSIKSGKVEQFNKKHRKVWEQMIVKMNDAINGKKGDRDLALPIMYFLENSINERTNPWAMGGIFIGYNKATNGKFIYDHAFPQAQAARLIMNAILSNNNTEFNTQFERLKNNYYVIALTKKDQQLVNDAGGASTIGDNESWFDRLESAKVNLSAYTYAGNEYVTVKDFVEGIKSNKNLKKSITKAAVKNNLELPKSQRLPKGSTNEQVLTKMQELDNEANEARIKYSKSQDLNEDFNNIIEAKTGIATYKRFSPAKAQVRGASKGKFNFFIPPSAEDFVGLLYKTLAKDKLGDRQMQWYKDNLLDPYARAMNDISAARVAMFNDYKQLKEDLKVIPKDLKKKSVDEYTREQAVRVYIWNKQGNNIPGLFKTDQKELVDYINNDPELRLFTEQLIAIQKNDDYSAPKEGWLAGSITTDLLDGVNSIKRKKYLEQWQTNVDLIFSEENMNKLEAAFGKPYVKALENILTRMKTGRNKPFTSDSLAGRVTDWLNNSTGAIMFFNTRSAVLQTISSINFINWSDNNIYQAGKAFANQPQYWKDFKFLFNSDFLKERRGGSRFNVAESEIADAAKKDGARGVISKILQAGFLPTQMADSFAIASGGATFYRNRVKSYIKEGLTEAEAQEKAFLDFREIAEESQQSSRPR